jgi:hypothetical protein
MNKLLSVIAGLLLLTGAHAGPIVEPETKTAFERTVAGETEGVELACTGVGCRKKTSFNAKVFAMAHWIDASVAGGPLADWAGRTGAELASDQRFFDTLASADVEKRIGLVLMRDLKAEQLRDGFESGLELARSGGLSEASGPFLAFFDRDLKKGSAIELRSLPGGTVVVVFDGVERGRIGPDPAFAADLWRVYFGERVADKHLETVKKQLISAIGEVW